MMSPTLLAASVIVVAASVAFVVIGNRYAWDVTSVGHSRWTQIVGAVAIVALAGVTAVSRASSLLTAALIVAAGAAIAAVYVVAYRWLSARVRAALKGGAEA